MKPEQRIVSRLLTMFGEPRTDDPIAYMNEFEKAVAGFPASVLEQAGNDVIRRSKFWPRPAEIVETCDAICRRMEAEKNAKNPKPVEEDLPPPTPEQRQRAREILTMAIAAMRKDDALKPLPDVSRPRFEAMLRNSPNAHLYPGHAAIARRITGERDE